MISLHYTPAENSDEPRVDMQIDDNLPAEKVAEQFQRFLLACGYLIDCDEDLQFVKRKSSEQDHDVIRFNDCYDFADNTTVIAGTGLFGGMGEDHFAFAGASVPIPGSAGTDIISFS